ncbi:MAG TPA: hypothetical protein GXX19_09040 [Syntrophomonadaceae bacterium]|nr:hypothetical protein [Syntrophomonadaceae bacterium]
MKINADGKSGKILIEVEKDESWEKVLDYLEALQWLINGQKQQVKESFQERVCR